MLLKTDLYDNRLVMVDRVQLYLHLAADGSRHLLANINRNKDRLELTRHKMFHLLKPDSYGFNYEMLKMAEVMKTVLITEEAGEHKFRKVTAVYEIPIADILDSGFFIDKQREGLEQQIFLARTVLKKYEIHKKITV